jgi:hypothetical protein
VELPEGWNDAAKNSFVEYLDSAVKECREFRDRGGQVRSDGRRVVVYCPPLLYISYHYR